MTIKKLTLLLSVLLNACATQNTDQFASDGRTTTDSTAPLNASLNFQQQFKSKFSGENSSAELGAEPQTKDSETLTTEINNPSQEKEHLDQKHNINFYVRGLMQDLVSNLQYVNATTPVAVVSFVMLDGDYNHTNLLGNQITESLMHEIHKFGIPVIDFKTTDYIRVTEQGDFAFTRDYEEVNPSMPARYIVGGTMVKIDGGYLVNARIVGIKSKAVVASAQSFIPNKVADFNEKTENMDIVSKTSLPNPTIDKKQTDSFISLIK